MSVIKPKYDANYDAVTITLAGLADDGWRQSAVIDNTTDRFADAFLSGSIQVGTTPTDGRTIDIYGYAEIDTGNYSAGASGSDDAYTADGQEPQLRFLTTIVVDASSDIDYEFGPILVARAFGGILPAKWGIVVHNRTLAALNATGTNNAIKIRGLQFENV